MAEVFETVKGKKLELFIATLRVVQDGLMDSTVERAERARAILKAHERDGHSRIEIERWYPDRAIVLNDERGQLAAMTIEFGRKGKRKDKNGNQTTFMPAVAPLRKATGLD